MNNIDRRGGGPKILYARNPDVLIDSAFFNSYVSKEYYFFVDCKVSKSITLDFEYCILYLIFFTSC